MISDFSQQRSCEDACIQVTQLSCATWVFDLTQPPVMTSSSSQDARCVAFEWTQLTTSHGVSYRCEVSSHVSPPPPSLPCRPYTVHLHQSDPICDPIWESQSFCGRSTSRAPSLQRQRQMESIPPAGPEHAIVQATRHPAVGCMARLSSKCLALSSLRSQRQWGSYLQYERM